MTRWITLASLLFWGLSLAYGQPLSTQGRLEIKNYTFKDIKNQKVSLRDFKGKVVILDFWASWCQPCVASFSTTESVMRKLEQEPVVLLTINTDAVKAKWKPAVRKHHVPGTALYAKKKHPALRVLEVESLPRYVIIDKKGQVVLYHARSPYEEIETIRKLCKE